MRLTKVYLAARCVRASVCAPGEAVQDLHMPFRNVISPSVCTVTGHVHVPYKRTNSSWSSYCSWSALSQMSCKHARTGNNLIALHETLPDSLLHLMHAVGLMLIGCTQRQGAFLCTDKLLPDESSYVCICSYSVVLICSPIHIGLCG